MSLTLLHFANVRLGATFTHLGVHGREHRAEVLSTFSTLGDLAHVERVQGVLLSGDLFDCPVPSVTTLNAVHAFCTRLRQIGIPLIILPGARDPDGIFNPLRQPDSRDLFPGAVILGPEKTSARVESLNLLVRALPMPNAAGDNAGVPTALPPGGNTYLVGLTYRPAGNAIQMRDLAIAFQHSGLHYVGVGGILQFAVEIESDTTICSPGVPEPLDWGQERGSVAVLRFDDQGSLQVERKRTGSHSFARRELAVTPENARAVTNLISRLAHPNLALEVVLTGVRPFDVLIDPARIESELAPNFFHLRIVDRTNPLMASDSLSSLPQGTILGNFARVMDQRLRDAGDDEQAAFDREAYQLGMSLLQGGSAIA